MKRRVAHAKARDVCREAGFAKPAEHLVKLWAHKEPNDGHGKSAELDRPAEDTAKHFSGFEIVQFAPRDLQLSPNKFRGAVECQCHKGPDVIGCNGLVRFIAAQRISELPF